VFSVSGELGAWSLEPAACGRRRVAWRLVAFCGSTPHSLLLVFGVVTRGDLILKERATGGGWLACDVRIDADIYFVLLWVCAVHQRVAVMYLNSKWKLSFYLDPKC